MSRRTSWRYLNGYSQAKRQMKRGSRTTRNAGEVTDYSLVVILGISLLCLIVTALYVGFKTDPVNTGIILGAIIVPPILLFLALRYFRKEQKKRELIRTERERRSKEIILIDKYGDEELVAKLMGQQAWTGQIAGMLKDSLGPP